MGELRADLQAAGRSGNTLSPVFLTFRIGLHRINT